MEKAITAVVLRQTYSAEVWKARIRSCRSSGQKVKTWCAENAISIQTYYRWERKLLSEAEKQRTRTVNGRFAELPIASTSETGAVVQCSEQKAWSARSITAMPEETLTLPFADHERPCLTKFHAEQCIHRLRVYAICEAEIDRLAGAGQDGRFG